MDLAIQETTNTPRMTYSSASNEWIISGRSYPKEAFAFYEPLLKWINMHESVALSDCNLQFKMEFFNTSSSKVFLDILMKLKKIKTKNNSRLSIKWYYEQEDEDMKETGEMLMTMSGMPFEFISH